MKISELTPIVLILAAGCSLLPSVGPDYEKPAGELPVCELPEAGAPTTNLTATGEYAPAAAAEDPRRVLSAADLAGWWSRFDDPQLDGLVACAISNSLSYRIAQERLIAARWRLLGTYAAYLPHIGGNLAAQRTEYGRDTSTAAATGGAIHRDVFTGGFDATWEIDIFGGSRRQTESARATVEAETARVQDAWVSLTAEIASEYIRLRTVQARIAVARTNLVLQSETLDIIRSRMESGIGDELAVSQSQYIVDETRAAIPVLLSAEEAHKNAIALLAGEVPGAWHGELGYECDRDWLSEPVRIDTLDLDLIRMRPDVRAAERDFAAAVADIGVAEAQWYPRLFLNGQLGFNALHADNFFRRDALVGAIGPSVSWPLFQGGNILANVKATEAAMHEKALAYELAVNTAYGEVRDAYAAYTQEYFRYQSLESAVRAAREAVSIAKNLYQNGLKDFMSVIDAQRSLLSLQESAVESRGKFSEILIALFKALGGGLARNGE